MNALVVGVLLYAVYGFIGNVPVTIYPKFGMDSYDLKNYTKHNDIYSKVKSCLKFDMLSKRESCVKDLDRENTNGKILSEAYRFDAFRNLFNKFSLLIIVFAYFVFFRRFISIGDYNAGKYEGARKPSYKRIIRK